MYSGLKGKGLLFSLSEKPAVQAPRLPTLPRAVPVA